MGKYREMQNINMPVKLGTDTYFITFDVDPGNGESTKQLIAIVEKDDGTKKTYKGAIPEFQGVGTGALSLTFSLNEIV